MQLTATQQKQLYEALLAAYPTLPDLDRLTTLILGENLYAIAGRGTFRQVALDLIRWGEAQGKLAILVAAVLEQDPGDRRLRSLLKEVKRASKRAEPELDRLDIPFNVPFPRNQRFVDREEELNRLTQTLASNQALAIVGVGGIGKTQLAVEFAYRMLESGEYPGGILWLNMNSVAAVPAQIASLAGPDILDLPGYDPAAIAVNLAAVQAALQSEEPRLLILDDVADTVLLEEWYPAPGGSRVIITTRDLDLFISVDVTPIYLGPLSHQAALELLLMPRAAGKDVRSLLSEDATAATAGAICQELGYLPLALSLAAGFLETYPHTSLASYYKRLRSGAGENNPVSPELGAAGWARVHYSDLLDTLEVSYGRLDSSKPVDGMALTVLHRAAHFATAPIPRRLMLRAAGLDPDDPDTTGQISPVFDLLHTLSLLQSDQNGACILHPLIAAFVRSQSPDATTDIASDEEALIFETRALRESGYPPGSAIYLEHLRHAVERAEPRADTRAANLMNNLAALLRSQGEREAARDLYERALAIWENIPGLDGINPIVSLNNLASLLQSEGELVSARSLYERALSISEQASGPNRSNTATSLNNLASLLQMQGDYDAARPLYERALAIREQVLGPNHPDSALALNNLASLLQMQGDYDAARPLYERALAIREQVLGPNHPETALALNNLAGLLYRQEDLSTARSLLEQSLAILQRALGPQHPTARVVQDNVEVLSRETAEIRSSTEVRG